MVKELPRELWLEIFKHFILNFGFVELYKYRKVCKVWCELIIVIMVYKLTDMITKIKCIYQIIRYSHNIEEEINSLTPESIENEISQQIARNFISYNYKTESFEYNFITVIKKDEEKDEEQDEEKKEEKKEEKMYKYKFCIIFHLIYKTLNFRLVKKLKEYLIENSWLNFEEDIIDNDTTFSQKIVAKGDKLLAYIDQIDDFFDYLFNLPIFQ
ncbi:hypothetical protein C1645_821299 [Glomus cerebriforme]|uniref:F-box domain-containing protein n=1 Tax=Glomus cerebriforme TaxID=658196 RepID=A0A397T2B1_9GLOM|nr:hypothetical protein C1645_821299 [Glomus cerebriforme]